MVGAGSRGRVRIQAAQYSSTKRSWYLSARMRSASSRGIGRSSPSAVAIDCSRTARSSVIELSTAQRTSTSATTTPWFRRMTARRWPSASATARPCSSSVISSDVSSKYGDAVGEQDCVVREQLELGGRRAEGGRVGGMGVDDGADVWPRAHRSPCG